MLKIKQIALSCILFVIQLNVSTYEAKGQGINFLNGNYQNAIETAKRANKVLFVEVYLNGCPHCTALAPVLEEKKVGDFFNAQFTSFKMEANSEDSKLLQQQKGVTYVEFPLFFFFDPNSGQLLHQATPGERATRNEAIEEVIKHGRDAVDPVQRTANYHSRYAKGDRNLVFLINYAKYTKSMKDMTLLWRLNEDIAKIITQPSDLESKTGFYVLQRLIDDYKNPMAVYFFNNINKYKSKYPSKEVSEAGETILYYTLYGKRANELSVDEVVKIRQNMVKLGLTPTVAATRTILKELDAYFRARATAKATARLNEYRKNTPMVLADYAYLIRYFNEKATDNSYISSLLLWVEDAAKLAKPAERNTKQVADLYLEQSRAYQRIGKKTEAKKALQTAINTAQKGKIDTKSYSEELSKIK